MEIAVKQRLPLTNLFTEEWRSTLAAAGDSGCHIAVCPAKAHRRFSADSSGGNHIKHNESGNGKNR